MARDGRPSLLGALWLCIMLLLTFKFDELLGHPGNLGLQACEWLVAFVLSIPATALVAGVFFLILGLIVGVCFIIFCILTLAIRILGHIGYRCRLFLQKRTLASRRIGWRSLHGFPDSKTPLLSAKCSHGCQTTSKFCSECFQIVQQSRLLSGALSILTPRTEWYKWRNPLWGSEFEVSRSSCQLCQILWYRLDEQIKLRLARTSTTRQYLPDRNLWLYLSIWKDEKGRYFMSLFEDEAAASRPENRPGHCKAIEIREGLSRFFQFCSFLEC
jgi:hypothetical protein